MTSIGKRIVLATGTAALTAALAAPGAQAATPTFHGLDKQGNLVQVERVKQTKRKANGKKKTKRFYAATDKVQLEFTPANTAGLVGIDERPISGELYGIGANSVVYRINPRTGVATGVAGPATPAFTTTLEGSLFGVDFNPMSPGGGAIRIVSDTNYNNRVSPDTGATGAMTPDADLNGAVVTPKIVHAAYDNSALSTTQPTTVEEYVLDSANDIIFVVNPPNNGTLTEPLDVSFDVTDVGGFDIFGNGLGYVATEDGSRSRLYSLDTETGKGKNLGQVRRTSTLTAIAIQQEG
ncbi:MAG: DUF4394 domain-containing protein [Solirubrobacteraceae bacterium]